MKNLIAVIVAVLLMALTFVIIFSIGFVSIKLVYVVIGVAVLLAIYIGTGGRAWFGTHEHPDRVIGVRVRFAEEDYKFPVTMPDAVLEEFKDGIYRAVFVEPIVSNFGRIHYADITARHAGHPISRIGKRGVMINGKLESGEGFISRLIRA